MWSRNSGAPPRNFLFLGAHCDDIEIGCGGTVLKYVRGRADANVLWVVLSSDASRRKEALASANDFIGTGPRKKILVETFRNAYFPQQWSRIKDYFEKVRKMMEPDVIFTHCRGDLHQDHRVMNELTWNTFRDHLVLEYEIPKYDADLGSPNLFVHLEEEEGREKAGKVVKHFASQRDKRWFTEDTFLSLMRIRGVESGAPGRYAEGFHCRKMIF